MMFRRPVGGKATVELAREAAPCSRRATACSFVPKHAVPPALGKAFRTLWSGGSGLPAGLEPGPSWQACWRRCDRRPTVVDTCNRLTCLRVLRSCRSVREARRAGSRTACRRYACRSWLVWSGSPSQRVHRGSGRSGCIAWNLKPSEHRVCGSSAENAVRIWRLVPQDAKELVMGLGKKAKNKAKTVKGKTKKGAGKVKRKGKKTKNAVKH